MKGLAKSIVGYLSGIVVDALSAQLAEGILRNVLHDLGKCFACRKEANPKLTSIPPFKSFKKFPYVTDV